MKEQLLLLLPGLLIIGVPIYSVLREGMSKKHANSPDYSKTRVLKLTAINLLLNSGLFIYFGLLLLSIVTGSLVTNWPLVFVFFMCVGLSYYGNGIYITSIVIENYTVLELKRADPFKKQFVATLLFHGPISHVFIYSGWLTAFMILALLDGNLATRTDYNVYLIVGAGVLSGLAFGASQIINGTSPFQLISGVIILILFLLGWLFSGFLLAMSSVAIYFLVINVTFIILILLYFLFLYIINGWISWDKFGYGRYKEGLGLKNDNKLAGEILQDSI